MLYLEQEEKKREKKVLELDLANCIKFKFLVLMLRKTNYVTG